MANLLTIVGLFFSAGLGGLTLRYVIRTDRRDVAAAEKTRIDEAVERGRQQALVQARLDELDERTRHNHPGEGQE